MKHHKKEFISARAAVAVLLTAFVLLSGCARENGGAAPTDTDASVRAETDAPGSSADGTEVSGTEILPGVTVSDPFPYTGKYVEDGSDEAVENLAAVTVTNRGGTDYLYVEFTLTTASGEYAFTASSVHAGTATTVLSKEKKTYVEGDGVVAAACPIHAEYQSPPTMCEDLFAFTQSPGSFTVRNISGRDLDGAITVYYKCTDENGYLGGITFRTVVNGLKAGAEQWVPSGHMGEIVFVTYEE